MMIPLTIRWRLPLSYAAIALLATLALGAVLLGTLRSTYRQQELDYLTGNAQAISQALAPLLAAELPLEAVKPQLGSYAFLSQTRVRLLDAQQTVLADSGAPEVRHDVLALSLDVDLQVDKERTRQTITHTLEPGDQERGYTPFILIRATHLDQTPLQDFLGRSNVEVTVREFGPGDQGEAISLTKTIAVTGTHPLEIERAVRQELGLPEVPNFGFISTLPAVGTPYGFGFSPAQASPDRRSDQRVSQPIFNAEAQVVGYIELSAGPAYGDQVLASVAWGWGLASGVAVLLAGLVGWGISRRISRPLTALTEVTGRMAEGDLSRRATVTGRDEIGRLAVSFNEMAGQVEETVQTLRRFVSDAAHELHTPLTALRTNLELAAAPSKPTDQTQYLLQAQVQAERLEHLTTNLLDLSRLEAQVGQEATGPVDLTQLLRDSQEVWASRAEQGELTFTCDLPPTPLIVRGQAGQLRQVLDNLLDNALKFTPAGGTVDLTLRQTAAGQAELSVTDSGIGIPAEEVAHLFSRFHRGRNATGYPGSGLGLAIVKTIVAQHGGHIEVKPLAHGTKFLLQLPSAA